MGVIVGAAIVADGRVLSGRRTAPPDMAGGWEFPGGKVEPGESELEALVRECREELGVTVRPGRRVGPDVALPNGWVLKVWWADIDRESATGDVEPRPLQDHDELAWLRPDGLSGVPWLPADWPIVHALADELLPEERLPGSRVGGAVRVGDTVRRPTGRWTAAVHDLIAFVHAGGLPAVPRLLGFDTRDREVLRYVPGRTLGAANSDSEVFRAESLVHEIGSWLWRLHILTADFPADERTWRRGRMARRPGQVVCHNDVSPDNVVLDAEGRLAAVLDWDMAAPGDPADDLAFAAWQFVLRYAAGLPDEVAGLRALGTGYGADPVAILDRVGERMGAAVSRMRTGADRGDVGLQRLVASGGPDEVERDVAALAERRDALVRRLRQE